MGRLSCGLIGLPNVGKSTLFNALLRHRQALASNFPFCTIEPNIGIVPVPDSRLAPLAQLSASKKVTHATMKVIDIAGLVEGASKGAGQGNQFLSHVHEVGVLLHVVRCFEGDQIIHVTGKVDPLSDVEMINLELILADLQMVERQIVKIEKQVKSHPELFSLMNVMRNIAARLSENRPLRSLSLNEEEGKLLAPYPFLTRKRMIYIANISEEELVNLDHPHYRKLVAYAEQEGSLVVPICAKLEEEFDQLSDQEVEEYLSEFQMKQSGMVRMIREGFNALGLITFLTTGEPETRAWTLTRGNRAGEAAGVIHTDLQRGFIRAEVITFEDFISFRGRAGAKSAGKARIEGKDYLVRDGDVMLFFHHSSGRQ